MRADRHQRGHERVGEAFRRAFRTIQVRPTLAAAIFLAGCSAARGANESLIPAGRLPQTVVPTHYSIRWRIDPAVPTFSGSERILLSFKAPTTFFWIHSKGLTIDHAYLLDAGGNRIEAKFEQVDPSGVARVTLARNVEPQNAQLEIDYRGAFNTQLQGLYSVSFREQRYVLTQFEATAARLALPCFDEPAFKTPFDLAVTIPSLLQAISNSAELHTQPLEDGFKTIQFATTKPLPTYLLALLVGELRMTSGTRVTANSVSHTAPVRAIGLAGDSVPLRPVLQPTVELTSALADYVGLPYPFEKLDVVAAPDFAGSGMENPGAVFYRESDLLAGDGAPLEKRQFSRILQAHELAHQWFGNLVTPAWWADLWLKEGVATFLSYRAADIGTRATAFDQLFRINTSGAMEMDALASASPVLRRVSTTEDIDAAYDAISYGKSAALLDMYAGYLGEDRFRSLLHRFLVDHAYGSASSEDFLKAIATEGGDALAASLRGFLQQPGIPDIHAAWSCDARGAATLSLTQTRYRPVGSNAESGTRWTVPVCTAFGPPEARSSTCTLVGDTPVQVTLPPASCLAIFPNRGGRGYYHLDVAPAEWNRLLGYSPQLGFGEAISLARSIAAAFRSGSIGGQQLLSAAHRLSHSSFAAVAFALVPDVLFIRDFVVAPCDRAAIDAQLESDYLQAAREALASPADADADIQAKRSTASRLMALDVGQPEIRNELAKLGATWVHFDSGGAAAGRPDRNELRGVAIAAAVQVYGRPLIDAVLRELSRTTERPVRAQLIEALAWARPESGMDEVLGLLGQSVISDTEAYELLLAIGSQPGARRGLLQFLSARLPDLMKRLPTDRQGAIGFIVSGGYQGRIGGSVRAGLCSDADLAEFVRVLQPAVAGLSAGLQYFEYAREQISQCSRLAAVQRVAYASH